MENLKKVAFIFPGQGSQRVGMGKDIYLDFPSARHAFDEADNALGFPLSRLCFEGPEEELSQTDNAQPAILTVSIAYLRVAREMYGTALLQPDFVAGHSLGEYTALVAASAVSFPEAVRLVRKRGELMNEAGKQQPGGMAAIIGLDEKNVREICQITDVEISNINSPEQIVISGTQEKLARARELATTKGARRVIPLRVSGAFHSHFMMAAARELKKVIEATTFSNAVIPLVANTNGKILTNATEIKQELLDQLTSCVQWSSCVKNMIHAGTSIFFEVGPGEVLTGLVRRIDPSVQTCNINNLESLVRLAEVMKKS